MRQRGQNRNKTRHSARAFSMLELTFVIVIIGVVMGIAAMAFGAQGQRARAGATKATMSVIKQSLEAYNANEIGYPPTLSGLQPAYIPRDKPLKDGWRREFYYEPTGTDPERPFQLKSYGADGISGTADDIDVWTMMN